MKSYVLPNRRHPIFAQGLMKMLRYIRLPRSLFEVLRGISNEKQFSSVLGVTWNDVLSSPPRCPVISSKHILTWLAILQPR